MPALGTDLLVVERAGVAHKATVTEILAAATPDHTWDYYAINWSTAPTLLGLATSPIAGSVYSYTLGGVTRYRLVPTSYSSSEDAFYSEFLAGVCTGLIVRRGV